MVKMGILILGKYFHLFPIEYDVSFVYKLYKPFLLWCTFLLYPVFKIYLFFKWRITALQNFVVFYQSSTWISHWYKSFYHEHRMNFVILLRRSYDFYPYHSVCVAYHIYWFMYIKTSLHPRDQFHMIVVVYDPFNVLLNSASILMRLFASMFIRDMDL